LNTGLFEHASFTKQHSVDFIFIKNPAYNTKIINENKTTENEILSRLKNHFFE